VKRAPYHYGGVIALVVVGLTIAFVMTKHLWFDGIGAPSKALFWTTLLGPTVAALGWYVAANENYRNSRNLELEKQERERKGVLRQANLLLRMAIKSLDDFFWIFKSPSLHYALLTWNRLSELLYDRASATALSDADYHALEDFWSRFGKMIGMAQDEMQKWTTEEHEHDYPATPDERHDYLGQLFADPLPLLEKAVTAFGDAKLRADFDATKLNCSERTLPLSSGWVCGRRTRRASSVTPVVGELRRCVGLRGRNSATREWSVYSTDWRRNESSLSSAPGRYALQVSTRTPTYLRYKVPSLVSVEPAYWPLFRSS
jgi:hypothetical protein